MIKNSDQKVTIIGAGLAGCFLALMLAKRGFQVHIYERSTEEEILNTYTGARSYNLTFYDFGVNALKEAGVWDEIEPTLVKLIGSITQITNNSPRFIKEKPYFAVQRDTLLNTLINNAKKYSQVKFYFGKALCGINRTEKTIILQDTITKQYSQVACEVIFGADGVNSQVRPALQWGQPTNHIQEYADWEYKQIEISNQLGKQMHLQKDIMYGWTRKNSLILAHPNHDESFSALLIVPKDKNHGFAALRTELAIRQYITKNFIDFTPAITEVTHDLLNNPISYFVTIYTTPWYYKDFMVVIGDAAHGFNPFYGQGVSAAFADCLTIVGLIDKHEANWKVIFPLYQQMRKKHTDALATLSKENIRNYRRAKKADYQSIYNKVDVLLYSFFPKLFAPPPFVHIGTNPLLTGDYMEKHLTQRKRQRWIGVPIVIGLATGLIAIQEYFTNALRKK